MSGDQFSFRTDLRLEQPTLGLQIIEVQPTVIAHPTGVDRVVLTRRLAVDHIFPRADDGVAAGCAAGADALGFFQEPNAHFKTKIGRSECADRADINGVERIIVLQPFAWVRGQHGVTAPINEPKHVVVRDLVAKTNAARAENAPLIVERNARPEHDIFRFLDFVLEKT